MNKFAIRQATDHDVDALAEIVQKYREFQGVTIQDKCKTKDFIRERIIKSESIILIAISEESNTIIGFLQLYPTFSTVSLQRQWLLNDFYVVEEKRNHGVGTALMQSLKEHFRGVAKGFILVTTKSNIGAKRFYDKHGWKTDVFDFYTYMYDTNT